MSHQSCRFKIIYSALFWSSQKLKDSNGVEQLKKYDMDSQYHPANNLSQRRFCHKWYNCTLMCSDREMGIVSLIDF